MRRVIIMLDVTEAEAEQIVEALDDVAPVSENGAGIRQAFEDHRSLAKPEAQGMTLAFRSTGSGALGGKTSAIAMTELNAS